MRHHIQKAILDRLATADSLRYADINTNNLDGNVFTYHLKQLAADQLVAQNADKTYGLTQLGRAYIVHRYENLATQAHSIFLVIIRHNNKLLLRKRLTQPMLGYSGFIHGEPLAGQPLIETVISRVRTKAGLTLESPHVHSSGLVQITVDDELNNFSHVVLIEASVSSLALPIESDETGVNYWVDESDLETIEKLLPSCIDLLAHSRSKKSWFDLSYSV